MAFSLLFLLDVGNNVTMEPYRAYVNDRLDAEQRSFGFLSQSAFTGLAQCLAYLSPTLLVTWFGLSKDATAGGGIDGLLQVGGRAEPNLRLRLPLVGIEHVALTLARSEAGTADEMIDAAKHGCTRPRRS